MTTLTRFLYLLLLTAGTLPMHSIAQNKHTSASAEQEVTAIRNEFKRINTLPLQKEQFTYEVAGCVEEGKVVCYFSNKALVKIAESGSIGDGSWVREFYYRNGKCIFCYEKLVGGPAEGAAVTTEYRFYIKNDKAVKCMENSTVIPADSKSTEIITMAQNLLRAYPTKDFGAALCQ